MATPKDKKDKKDPPKDKGKISISQFIKENNVKSEDFYNKLVPKLKNLDFNTPMYTKTELNGLIKGE